MSKQLAVHDAQCNKNIICSYSRLYQLFVGFDWSFYRSNGNPIQRRLTIDGSDT